MQLTTQEFIQLINQKEIDYFKPEEVEPCYYRAIDSKTGKWYCEGKLIIPIVCTARQQKAIWKRHILSNSDIFCHPEHKAESVPPQILRSFQQRAKGKILKEHPTS